MKRLFMILMLLLPSVMYSQKLNESVFTKHFPFLAKFPDIEYGMKQSDVIAIMKNTYNTAPVIIDKENLGIVDEFFLGYSWDMVYTFSGDKLNVIALSQPNPGKILFQTIIDIINENYDIYKAGDGFYYYFEIDSDDTLGILRYEHERLFIMFMQKPTKKVETTQNQRK